MDLLEELGVLAMLVAMPQGPPKGVQVWGRHCCAKVAGYILDHNAQYITGCQDPEAHVWMQKLSELLNKGEITDKAAAVKWVREQKHEKTLDAN